MKKTTAGAPEAFSSTQQARKQVARFTLKLQPSHARVVLDGVPLARGPNEQFWLELGDHTLEAEAPGYARMQRKLRVETHRDQTLALELVPLTAAKLPAATAAALSPTPSATAKRSEPIYTSPWLWLGGVGLTVGVALIVASIVGATPEYEVRPPTATRQTPPGAVIQLLRAP